MRVFDSRGDYFSYQRLRWAPKFVILFSAEFYFTTRRGEEVIAKKRENRIGITTFTK